MKNEQFKTSEFYVREIPLVSLHHARESSAVVGVSLPHVLLARDSCTDILFEQFYRIIVEHNV